MWVSKLELRIPPIPLALVFALLMWLISLVMPSSRIFDSARNGIVAVLVGLALYFALAGVYSFRKAKTTVDPRRPDSASSLVMFGIYRWTRNPMYVGFLFALFGWGVYLSNVWALILSFGYILYMNRFQIRPEERMLEKAFGEEYVLYKQNVRRWL